MGNTDYLLILGCEFCEGRLASYGLAGGVSHSNQSHQNIHRERPLSLYIILIHPRVPEIVLFGEIWGSNRAWSSPERQVYHDGVVLMLAWTSPENSTL